MKKPTGTFQASAEAERSSWAPLTLRLLGILFLAVALLLGSEPSARRVFLFYSAFKLLVIFGALVLAGTFLLVSRNRHLSSRLLISLTSLGVFLSAVEGLLWWRPLFLPSRLLEICPPSLIARAIAQDINRPKGEPRQRFLIGEIEEDFMTEGYLRHYVPNLQGVMRTEDADDKLVPIRMDEIGFRNLPGLYSSSPQLDVVLLGDSFTRGTSRVTSAEFLGRLSGLRVYNLGDLGGAPQQWLLALEKYGLPKKPPLIVVNFYEGNDPLDAVRLQSIMDSGRSLEEYYRSFRFRMQKDGRLGSSPLQYSAVLSFFYGAYQLTTEVKEEQPFAVAPIKSQGVVRIPLCCPSLGPLLPDKVDADVARGVEIVEHTLRRIQAAAPGAVVVVSYVPTVATVYGDQARIEGAKDPSVWIESHVRQQNLAGMIAIIARRIGIQFFDVTASLRNTALRERLYGDGGHFSQLGYQRYAELLHDRMRVMGIYKQKRLGMLKNERNN